MRNLVVVPTSPRPNPRLFSPPFVGSDPMKIYNVVLRGINAIEMPLNLVNHTTAKLIKQLCDSNPTQRLGYGIGGTVDIQNHKCVHLTDWIQSSVNVQ